MSPEDRTAWSALTHHARHWRESASDANALALQNAAKRAWKATLPVPEASHPAKLIHAALQEGRLFRTKTFTEREAAWRKIDEGLTAIDAALSPAAKPSLYYLDED